MASSSTIPPRDSRPYDVVLYGATGFTGGLVAHYLAGGVTKTADGISHRRVNKPLPDGTPRPPLKWAIAGRDQKKLDALKRDLEVDERVSRPPDVIVADAKHAESLRKMTASTCVVLSTVGPFLLYGTPLVAACVETGTDYCDTTGEAVWVDRMIRQYGEQAERNGAILSSMCGFDSVPSDLGCYMVAHELAQTYNTRLVHAQGFTSAKGAGVSGGTLATIINGMSLPAEDRKRQRNKYILNPPGTAPARTRTLEKDQLLPRFDTTIQRWTAPWLMSLVNTRVVRRSIGLRRQLDPKNGGGYGDEASYNECMPTSSLLQAIFIWLGLVVSMLVLMFKPTRWLAQKFILPAPGEGPSREARERTTFAHRVVGEGENGQKVISTIGGGDPGYGDTARMVSEVALILAQDRDALELNKLVEKRGRNGLVGGFYTPSVVGGQLLVERLRKAGMTLKVHEFREGRVGNSGPRRLGQPAPGRVVAVHKDAAHHFSKPPVEEITLVKAIGVEGDAHAGATVQHRSRVAIDPTQANLRQVHLIREELFDEVAKESNGRHNLKPGQLGENITTSGLDLHRFPVGTILHIGSDGAQLQLTGTRTPCPQIDEKAYAGQPASSSSSSSSDPLTKYLHEKDVDGGVRVKGGVMTIVRAGGRVRPGDEIRVELPKGEHRPLPRV